MDKTPTNRFHKIILGEIIIHLKTIKKIEKNAIRTIFFNGPPEHPQLVTNNTYTVFCTDCCLPSWQANESERPFGGQPF